MHQHLIASWQNPVQAAQTVFRLALNAMSEPGLVQTLPTSLPLDGLNPATWALLQTLLDADTSVFVSESLASKTVLDNMRFHCACRVVLDKSQADFVVCDMAELLQWDWRGLKRGSERSPEHSATVLVQVADLDGEEHSVWQGPGILQQRHMGTGLNRNFWLKRAAATAFPLGVDVVVTSGERLLALPRSTNVQFEGVATCM